MATAIPPRAAEVTSNRPVRQKFLRSGRGGAQPGAWSIGTGSVLYKGNLRKGTGTWSGRLKKKLVGETYFPKSASMVLTGETGPKKYRNRYLKSSKMHFFTKFCICS
jgi:hypothetical protein